MGEAKTVGDTTIRVRRDLKHVLRVASLGHPIGMFENRVEILARLKDLRRD